MISKIIKQIIKSALITTGAILLILFVYFRFIRERLPREIPFNLIGIGIIVFICYRLVKNILILKGYKIKNTSFLINVLTKPIVAFDTYLKNNYLSISYYSRYILKLIPLSKKVNYNMIYFLLEIFPRSLLLFIFMLDVFFFKEIFYLYKIIWISILPLISNYLIYCYNQLKKEYIIFAQQMTDSILTTDFIITKGYSSFLSIEQFVEEQTKRMLNNVPLINYTPMTSSLYDDAIYKRLNVSKTYHFTSKEIKQNNELVILIIDLIPKINTIISLYEKESKRYKKIKIGIFTIYLISWVYILIISIYALPMDTYINMWDWIIQEMPRIKEESIEPFTGIELEIESGKSKLGSILNRVE